MATFCDCCVFECMAGEALACEACGLVGVEMPEAAWAVGDDHYLAIQRTDEGGFDYTLFDSNYRELDGGQIDGDDGMTMEAALFEILALCGLAGKTLYPMDYYEVIDRAEEAAQDKESAFDEALARGCACMLDAEGEHAGHDDDLAFDSLLYAARCCGRAEQLAEMCGDASLWAAANRLWDDITRMRAEM